jgi:hypothetical protein
MKFKKSDLTKAALIMEKSGYNLEVINDVCESLFEKVHGASEIYDEKTSRIEIEDKYTEQVVTYLALILTFFYFSRTLDKFGVSENDDERECLSREIKNKVKGFIAHIKDF